MTTVLKVLQRLDDHFNEGDKIEFIDERDDGKHFKLNITSDIFEGTTRVERSKMIYKILDDLLSDGTIHALKLKLKTFKEIENAK